MKFGIVISMYDEIEEVIETINSIKGKNCKIVTIQSDPGDKKKRLEKSLSDEYIMLPDLAGSRKEYQEMVEKFKKGAPLPIAPFAVTRNFSKGFSMIKKFDVDYVIGIEGDTRLKNFKGVQKIIEKMKTSKKIVAFTRTLGYTLHDEKGKLTRYQDRFSTDIMPQFFIVDINAVKQGLCCDMKVTNPHTSEVCLGDEIRRYCDERKLDFFSISHIISDYAYPRNIEGLEYNPEQISKIPQSLEGLVTNIRKKSGKKINDIITNAFRIYLELKKKN